MSSADNFCKKVEPRDVGLDVLSGLAPEVIKLFSCSTHLSKKLELLLKTKISTNEDGVFIMLINVKMPTNVGILTIMSRINFVLS